MTCLGMSEEGNLEPLLCNVPEIQTWHRGMSTCQQSSGHLGSHPFSWGLRGSGVLGRKLSPWVNQIEHTKSLGISKSVPWMVPGGGPTRGTDGKVPQQQQCDHGMEETCWGGDWVVCGTVWPPRAGLP